MKRMFQVLQREKMVRRVLSMAMNGSISAVNYLSDRAEGKAKETIETKVTLDEVIVE